MTRHSGSLGWIAGCANHECRSGDQADWLRTVAAAVGTTPYELIEDAPRWLADNAVAAEPAEPAPLPSHAAVEGWHHALLANAAALNYLRRERGLSREVIARHRLGYAQPGASLGGRLMSEFGGFVLPILRGGEVVAVRKRFWPSVPRGLDGKSVKIAGPSGHDAALYPSPPRRRTVILAEGELDALAVRSRGLPAVTTTCGATMPDHLAGGFKGRNVAVIYDTGALAPAARTVERLREAGAAEAWAVDLGLPRENDDLTDWFVTYKRTTDDLLSLIRRARRSS